MIILRPQYDQDILVSALYEYILRKQDDLEIDLDRCRDNALMFVQPDSLDLVYWLESNVRLQIACEIFRDITFILKTYRAKPPPK